MATREPTVRDGDILDHVKSLDSRLFSFLDAMLGEWDRRALLALHGSIVDSYGVFSYLEIGSYLGGSLQVVMRDPRCEHVMSLDARTAVTPHEHSDVEVVYENNDTEQMLTRLRTLPDVAMGKLTTYDAGTDLLHVSELPVQPTYCFVDGEHTSDAALRDAYFCAEAMRGVGVIAFHDFTVVGSAISNFLRDNWHEVSFALAFPGPSSPTGGGGVFAVELGGSGILRHPLVNRAIDSSWHNAVWKTVNRSRVPVLCFLAAWATMPAVDAFIMHWLHGYREYVRGVESVQSAENTGATSRGR